MNWWGKMIGSSVGLLGGPIGGLIGGYIGHKFDQSRPQIKDEKEAKLLYYAYFFSSAAKIAKANGQISQQEIEKVESIIQRMRISAKEESFAKNVFRKAKNSKRSIDDDFKEVAKLIGYEQNIAQSFVGGLFEIVKSNGKKVNELQLRFLLRAEERLKLQSGTVQHWFKNGYKPPQEENSESQISLDEAYEILNVTKDSSDSELKKAYHSKAANFHPDKLKSKNLPDEFTQFANAELAKINLAYETIQNARVIRL